LGRLAGKHLRFIKTDGFGNETYWAIVNKANEIIIDGGNEKVGLNNLGSGYPEEHESAYASNDTIIENFILPNEGCYQVFVTDAYGDGFCCSAGSGSFEIKDSKGNSLVQITDELQDKVEAALRLEWQPPRANFFIVQDGNAVRVTDASALAEEWFWIFGDGTDTVKVKNPTTHIYDENDTYQICLIVKNSFGVDTSFQTIKITEAPVAVDQIDFINHIQISPNPASDWVKIKFSQAFSEPIQQIEIYSVEGKLMKKVKPANQGLSSVVLEIKDLKNGIYFITFELRNTTVAKRLIISK